MGRRYRFWVYIMTTFHNTALYVGMTNNILRRVEEHREGKSEHTVKYQLKRLVYLEEFQYVDKAIVREKQLKHWKHEWKRELIEKSNPHWEDLTKTLIGFAE